VSTYDRPELRRWRDQAAAALGAAGAVAETPSWSCFLCEQAAQLAVKGLLHAVGAHAAAWGHDLTLLEARAASTFGADWPSVSDPAARLARHYIPARYPDAHPSGSPEEHYTAADAGDALADALAVLVAVDTIVAQLDAADHAKPDSGDGG
jgi:HEPN domain-containing protein